MDLPRRNGFRYTQNDEAHLKSSELPNCCAHIVGCLDDAFMNNQGNISQIEKLKILIDDLDYDAIISFKGIEFRRVT